MRITAGRADPKLVRQKLADYLAECEKAGTEPVHETYRFYSLMEDRVPLGLSQLTNWQVLHARTRFQSQVLRELNLLAAKGTLVKRGDRRDLHFYLPAVAARADEQEASRSAAAADELAARQRLMKRLEGLGLEPLVRSGSPVTLEPEDWEILVRLAEKGLRRENA